MAFAWFQWVAINNWIVGRWYLADVGNVHYMLLNTLRGEFMFSPLTRSNHYAYHFTPLLTLLAPITYLSRYPIPLVTTYNLALAFSPVPLYFLARKTQLSGAIAWALGVLFVANHYTGSIQLAYHFESWFVFFALCALALFDGGKPLPFWCAAIAALMVKEDAAVWIGVFAAFSTWRHWGAPSLGPRAIRLGVLCFGYGVFSGVVIWYFGRQQEGNALVYAERVGGFLVGAEVLKNLLLLLASVGGLCVFAGRAQLLLLVSLPLLLSRFEITRHLLYYYSYPVLPFLFYAAVLGAGNLASRLELVPAHRMRHAGFAAAIVGIGTVQAFLPTRTDGYRRWPSPVTARHEYRLKVARELLPPEAPAAIQFGLWGVTPSRAVAVDLRAELIRPEAYVFLDLKAPYGMPPSQYLNVVQPLFREVQNGERPLLHSRDQLYILGPRTGRN